MRKLVFLIACVSILALTLAGDAMAQRSQGVIGSGGGGAASTTPKPWKP